MVQKETSLVRIKKAHIFTILTILLVVGVYFYDVKKTDSDAQSNGILSRENQDQISYVQIIKKNGKLSLQKSNEGWNLLEPIQDTADNAAVENLLHLITHEKEVSLIKPSSEAGFVEKDLMEFGLDNPVVIYNLKSNSGKTTKISIGSVKNVEGNAYARVDEENQIALIASPLFDIGMSDFIYFREKKLYRHSLVSLKQVTIKSLNETIQLEVKDGVWSFANSEKHIDQPLVRDLIKKISEAQIQKYVFEGEPSEKELVDKSLDQGYLQVTFVADDFTWSVKLNVSRSDKKVYALTDKPTFLLQIDPVVWEAVGSASTENLRDRSGAFAVNTKNVKKIFIKQNGQQAELELGENSWKVLGSEQTVPNEEVDFFIQSASSLKVDQFIDDSAERSNFKGENMLIIKGENEKLILQLNWGPEYKSRFVFARTQLSPVTFALSKDSIDKISIDKLIKK